MRERLEYGLGELKDLAFDMASGAYPFTVADPLWRIADEMSFAPGDLIEAHLLDREQEQELHQHVDQLRDTIGRNLNRQENPSERQRVRQRIIQNQRERQRERQQEQERLRRRERIRERQRRRRNQRRVAPLPQIEEDLQNRLRGI